MTTEKTFSFTAIGADFCEGAEPEHPGVRVIDRKGEVHEFPEADDTRLDRGDLLVLQIDGEREVHVAKFHALAWGHVERMAPVRMRRPDATNPKTEAEALRATMDPRDRLIESLFEQLKRANLRVIALTGGQGASK